MWHKTLAMGLTLICVGCGDVDPDSLDRALGNIGDALGAGAQQYQRSQPAPPVFTNCQRLGNTINCTSF
jgi:hypothetical protein